MIRPLTGVTGTHLLEVLRQTAQHAAAQLDKVTVDGVDRYTSWADTAVASLGPLLRPEELDRLILTRRHWVLVSSYPPNTVTMTQLSRLELTERKNAIAYEADALERLRTSWGNARPLLPDTNLYLHHHKFFDEINWYALDNDSMGSPVVLVIPHVVVDELDRAKRLKGDVRSRARQTLRRFLDHEMGINSGDLTAALPAVGGAQLGVQLHFVPEDRGHRRLQSADDEIVDIASALEALIDRPVPVVTYDGGMKIRANAQGLSWKDPGEDLDDIDEAGS